MANNGQERGFHRAKKTSLLGMQRMLMQLGSNSQILVCINHLAERQFSVFFSFFRMLFRKCGYCSDVTLD